MTSSLFQQYEVYKTRYNPGIIWVDKSAHTVKKLKIIDYVPEGSFYNFRDHGFREDDYLDSPLVYFEILESGTSMGRLAGGKLVAWSQQYMEENYQVSYD